MSDTVSKDVFFKTPLGELCGVEKDGVLRIENVRYAFSERYGLPLAVTVAEQNVKIPVCPQNISPLVEKMVEKIDMQDYEITESCQFLTITRPLTTVPENQLPILIWIHGGSYEIGCGTVPTSNPTKLVREQNVIVVALTYRLGMFGFLGGYDDRPANLGIYDLLAGIKWVKNNISSVGGNPAQITLLGQSSGGDAIAHLLALRECRGLFKRAIINSAPLGLRRHRQWMNQRYSKDTVGFKNEKDVLKLVRMQQNVAPTVRHFGLKATMPFGVQYGFPPFSKEDEIEKRWRDNASYFDVLIGYNEDETAFYLKNADQTKGSAWWNRFLIRYSTTRIYKKPLTLFSENYGKAGGKIYSFVMKSEPFHSYFGAAHCIDLALLFEDPNAWQNSALVADVSRDTLTACGRDLRKQWARFMRTGSVEPSITTSFLKFF